MRLHSANAGGDFTPAPAGTHLAICIRFVDLGTQETEWQGQKKVKRQVTIGWELPEERMEDGRPFTISKTYTWSMAEKASLRHDLENWRGRDFTEQDLGPDGFDTKNLLGKGCLVSIAHETKNGRTYANVKSISKMMKGMAAPEAENLHVYFSLDEFNPEIYAGLSQYLREKIAKSPEYQAVISGKPIGGSEPPPHEYAPENGDSDIPF